MHYAHSRNRDPKTGYKVVRIPMTPEGHVVDKMVEPIDFFYTNPIDYRIRPVGVVSLFFHLPPSSTSKSFILSIHPLSLPSFPSFPSFSSLILDSLTLPKQTSSSTNAID